jgi:hypothetical protein
MGQRESAAQRLRTFREMAADARTQAARSSNPDMRHGFEQLPKLGSG